MNTATNNTGKKAIFKNGLYYFLFATALLFTSCAGQQIVANTSQPSNAPAVNNPGNSQQAQTNTSKQSMIETTDATPVYGGVEKK